MTEPNELEEAKQWSEHEIGDIILIAGTKLDGLKFMLHEPTRWVLLREVLAAHASHRNAALVKRVGELEQALRREWWLNHGHKFMYGDDGEMQCSECLEFGFFDYKNEPFERLVRDVPLVRVACSKAADSPAERKA